MAPTLKKIIILSDIHLTSDGKKIADLYPLNKLKAAINHLLEKHKDLDHLVFTGDLANNGMPSEYAYLKKALAELSTPITFMMGNHDNRDNFCKEFPYYELDENQFFQSGINLGDYFLLFLDSLKDPYVDIARNKGFLCQKRLNWLDNQLSLALNKKVILFVHHPPFPTGLEAMDAIRLENPEDLYSILEKYKNVVHIVSGHIHRNISGNYRDIGFSTFKSTSHQMSLNLNSEKVEFNNTEKSGYGVICLREDGLFIHNEEFD
mgnify:FL=1